MLGQLIFSGLSYGMVLALLAVSFVLVYKATRVFNLAQGALVMVGSYLAYALFKQAHWPFWLVVPVVVALSVGVGFLIEKLFWGRMANRDAVTLIIFTLMLNTVLVALVGMGWGAAELGFPQVIPYRTLNLLGAKVSTLHLFIAGAALLVILIFFYLYERTALGLALRASAADQEGAALMGVNVRRSFAWSWAMSGAIGSVAGIFLAAMVTLNLGLWRYAFMSFPAAVLGGIDSIGGALVGGILMGLAESLAGGYLDPVLGGGAQESVATVILFLILLVKPSGLFGTREIERL